MFHHCKCKKSDKINQMAQKEINPERIEGRHNEACRQVDVCVCVCVCIYIYIYIYIYTCTYIYIYIYDQSVYIYSIWIGHVLHRNCLLQRDTEGKIKG